MPNLLKQIPETMRKQGIPDEIMARFDFAGTGGAEEVMALINQMDKLLTEKQRLAVMQEQGCCKTGKVPAAWRAFGIEHADKTLAEKIILLNASNVPHIMPCRLNSDGTLSVSWGDGNGIPCRCGCGMLKKLPEGYPVPKTFCGCCGGFMRNNYQKALGVKLQLKEIASSSSSSNGKKRCEFLFEISEN